MACCWHLARYFHISLDDPVSGISYFNHQLLIRNTFALAVRLNLPHIAQDLVTEWFRVPIEENQLALLCSFGTVDQVFPEKSELRDADNNLSYALLAEYHGNYDVYNFITSLASESTNYDSEYSFEDDDETVSEAYDSSNDS